MVLHISFQHIPVATEAIPVPVTSLLLHHRRTCQRGISLTEMMQTAGSFLEKSLIDSVEEHVPVNEGVNFEKYLYLLHT